MGKRKEQSVEPAVVRYYTTILNDLKIHFYEQQINMGNSIDDALKNAESKQGGNGDNRPDIKILLSDTHARRIPVMVEAKGIRGKLEKRNKSTGEIELVTIYEKDGKISKKTGEPTHYAGEKDYTSITNYAVNGAVHYANAILDAKDYTEVIAIGVNGYDEENGNAKNLECKAYYISEKNGRIPKLIDGITEQDWNLLKPSNVNKLYKILDKLNLTSDEYEKIVSKAESNLDDKIQKIHQRIYDDKAITLNTSDKMYLFCGLIMAGLSAEGLEELKISNLSSSEMEKQSDGVKVMNQIEAYLDCKKCPDEKVKMILQILTPVFTHEDLWKPYHGESILKALYKQIKADIIPCLESPLHLDFMGRIFNRLGDWIPIDTNKKKNDVVLTPRYVAQLMAKLCRVNKDSYVWDRTMGSAGFLVTAMDLMIKDAQQTITDEKELEETIEKIKKQQLFGIESLPEVFILAVLNMILMGDGTAKMVRGDGHDKNIGTEFPANVFLLNPPYSAPGKGFVFVEEALSMMSNGYAAVLIKENAGSGYGLPYTRNILKSNTLLASIHMSNIFCGKAGVQTAIFLFKIGEKHNPKNLVKFIDFSNDGYARQSKKKSSQDVNLKNVDDATGRYLEIERIILGQQSETSYYTKANGLYIEDVISLKGNDWTFAQHKQVDNMPTETEFRQAMRDFIIWEMSQSIKRGQTNCCFCEKQLIKYHEFKIGELFDIASSKKKFNACNVTISENGYPYVVRTSLNNGIRGYIHEDPQFLNEGKTISFGQDTATMFYQENPYFTGDKIKILKFKDGTLDKQSAHYILTVMRKAFSDFSWGTSSFDEEVIKNIYIPLPIKENTEIDFEYMKQYMSQFCEESAVDIHRYLEEKNY